MKTAFVAAGLALLAGCAHEVQVVSVDPAKKCEPAPGLLQPCEAAARLPEDRNISFSDLLDFYQADRARLRRCAKQRDDLALALQTCNQAIDSHNAELAARLKPAAPK